MGVSVSKLEYEPPLVGVKIFDNESEDILNSAGWLGHDFVVAQLANYFKCNRNVGCSEAAEGTKSCPEVIQLLISRCWTGKFVGLLKSTL